jgi:hypothetical protein
VLKEDRFMLSEGNLGNRQRSLLKEGSGLSRWIWEKQKAVQLREGHEQIMQHKICALSSDSLRFKGVK